MRVFVTGATGFVGRALIPRLQRDGHAVVAWVRSPARARGLLGAEVEAAKEAEMTKLADVVEATAIRPIQVDVVPEAELTELRRRIKATRWPERETVADASQGVQLATTQALARYWATEYDWRKCESRLQALPQFMTEIDGLDIHFIHVRSKHENALPLIVTHGWPGSVVEQLKIIDPLTNPAAHGGSASDAFHVVIPSIPGYGYSGRPTHNDSGDAVLVALDTRGTATGRVGVSGVTVDDWEAGLSERVPRKSGSPVRSGRTLHQDVQRPVRLHVHFVPGAPFPTVVGARASVPGREARQPVVAMSVLAMAPPRCPQTEGQTQAEPCRARYTIGPWRGGCLPSSAPPGWLACRSKRIMPSRRSTIPVGESPSRPSSESCTSSILIRSS